MAHFYNCKGDSPAFLRDVGTPTQARKHGRYAYPSVTTVLGICKDPFIDGIWKPKMITKIAREKPNLDWQDVERLTYGVREHPSTGDQIESSEFGTAVHKAIEEITSVQFLGDDSREPTPFDDWGYPFIDWIVENKIKPVSVEYIISNPRIKIAGSIDFLGYMDFDGKNQLFLADYKCRSNTGGRAKTYPKDCQQLAIESYMIMKQHKLDYLPSCLSVTIDCDTQAHYHKWWTPKEMEKGIKIAKKCAELFWLTRM
jgi:hypothetical protein